jgi:hypothetical protein
MFGIDFWRFVGPRYSSDSGRRLLFFVKYHLTLNLILLCVCPEKKLVGGPKEINNKPEDKSESRAKPKAFATPARNA